MGKWVYCAVGVCVFLTVTSAAHATIGCAVVSSQADADSVNLHSDPDDSSEILRKIPLDDIVLYPQSELAPAQADGWVWVRHDINQDAIWQKGIYGWLSVENISDCG